MSIIEANNLSKTFKVNKKRNFIDYFKLNKNNETIKPVDSISFNITEGEKVGLIGLNGAGKSTLIKMMTGILLPTSGNISVLGRDPFIDRIKNNKEISTVFGQRCKLRWDISPMESYYLIKEMYDICDSDFYNRLKYLSGLLDLNSFIYSPVRTLSLGQKMKAELVSSFLYDPKIVFLDEPTIGLDIISKDSIIKFLKEVKSETTLILTTHDFEDIEKICDRVIILYKGKIIKDCSIDNISNIYDMENLEVVLKRIPSNIEKSLDLLRYTYTLDSNIIKIDTTYNNDKSKLVKEVYKIFDKDIDIIQFSKINFKDSLKYFLNENIERNDNNEQV